MCSTSNIRHNFIFNIFVNYLNSFGNINMLVNFFDPPLPPFQRCISIHDPPSDTDVFFKRSILYHLTFLPSFYSLSILDPSTLYYVCYLNCYICHDSFCSDVADIIFTEPEAIQHKVNARNGESSAFSCLLRNSRGRGNRYTFAPTIETAKICKLSPQSCSVRKIFRFVKLL